jgi:drug/metabolite transporter (DMT)-like permease
MRATRQTESEAGLDPRLLVRLIRQPLWLLGFAASVVGYGLQAVALYLAPVALVQPLIVTELLFALPAAAVLAGTRLGRREWSGALLIAAGISLFVLVGHPTGERASVSTGDWLPAALSVVGAVVVLVVLSEARIERPWSRAVLLAAGASICFGALSVLTKVVGHQFDHDGVATLGHPQPYALAVVAITGLLLSQTAFRIAPLSLSLPVIDIGEPAIGTVLALVVLGERIKVSAGVLAVVAVSIVAVVGGISLLDTSPKVRSAQRDISEGLRDVTAPAADAAQ